MTVDRDTFERLYLDHRPDVYRFVAHMTGSAGVADDLTHDVFLVAIQQLHRFEPLKGAPVAWLIGIARNHVRRWQHRRRWLSLTGQGGDEYTDWSVSPDPVDDLTRAHDEAALKLALLSLPARYREVVVLCDLQELTYDTAALVLRCKVGTVRSRLHRGRQRLATAIARARQSPASRPHGAAHLGKVL